MKALTLLTAILLLSTGIPGARAQSTPANAWTDVTLLLADGWRYREVTVYLDEHGAGLWLQRSDGSERLVDIDRVTRIIGADGVDITAAVLGGRRSPKPAPPPEQGAATRAESWDGLYESVETTAAATRPFKLAFTLEGGYGSPGGQGYGSYQPSWSAGARLRIGTSKQSYVGFGYRHQDLALSVEYGDYIDAHVALYEGTFGWMSAAAAGQPRVYFELGAALMQNTVSFGSGTYHHGYTANNGAFLLRTGALLPLSEAFAIDLGVSLAYKGLIFTDEYESDGTLVGAHVGLTWMN